MPYREFHQSGNIFFALFGAVALVGVVGASVTTILKGPVAGMQRVTKYTVAENNMIAAGKLALIAATNQPLSGDCDGDDMVEPIPYSTTGDGPFPAGGGYLPAEIGATRQDPWGNIYGYCVWDHGIDPDDPTDNDGECGGSTNFRKGADSEQYIALAVISSGPDRVFQSSCNDFDPENPDLPLVVKSAGSDDVVLAYTYAEAGSMSGGLWKLKSGDSSTAEVGNRNVEIAGSGGGGDAARIGYDEGLDMSGVGDFLAVKTDYIYARTADGAVSMESPLQVKTVEALEKPMGVAGEGVGTKSVIAPGLRKEQPTMPIAPDGQDWADAIVCSSTGESRIYNLVYYRDAGPSDNQVLYRYDTGGSTGAEVYYNKITGARGDVTSAGSTCPSDYADAIKVYYGGGAANTPAILSGWPDALRCGTFDGSSDGSILYLDGSSSNGFFRYTLPYSHAGSGAGSYSLRFNPDGSYNGEGGGADSLYANCKNKSISTLADEGKGIFFSGRGADSGTSIWSENGLNIYRTNGNVGIGTNTPNQKLHVISDGERAIFGHASAESGITYGGVFQSDSTDGRAVYGHASASSGTTFGGQFLSSSTSGRAVYGHATAATGPTFGGYFLNNSSSGYGVLGQATAASGSTFGGYFSANNSPNGTGIMAFGGTNGARIFSNAASGTSYGVYAQVASPDGYGIYSNGRMHSTGALTVGNSVTATAYYQSSDRHLKTEIERISDPFALLDGIEGKRFVWKDSNKPAYGVIAQDVETVIPDAVGENGDGFKTVEYDQLIAPLIEAVKQLKAEIDNLGRAMRELRADNDNLREEIRALTKGAH